MSVPLYTYFDLEDLPEAEIRARVVMFRLQGSGGQLTSSWTNLRIDHTTIFDTDDQAVQYIESKVTDVSQACAVRYRATPDSTRLRGAYAKLRNLVHMLGRPGNTLRVQRKIVLQREKIVNIKQELVPRSTQMRWMVGGLMTR